MAAGEVEAANVLVTRHVLEPISPHVWHGDDQLPLTKAVNLSKDADVTTDDLGVARMSFKSPDGDKYTGFCEQLSIVAKGFSRTTVFPDGTDDILMTIYKGTRVTCDFREWSKFSAFDVEGLGTIRILGTIVDVIVRIGQISVAMYKGQAVFEDTENILPSATEGGQQSKLTPATDLTISAGCRFIIESNGMIKREQLSQPSDDDRMLHVLEGLNLEAAIPTCPGT